MHKFTGMHLIRTYTGNEVRRCYSSYFLAFSSWITLVSCNTLGLALYIGIGDKTRDNENSYNSCHDNYLFLSKLKRSLQGQSGTI